MRGLASAAAVALLVAEAGGAVVTFREAPAAKTVGETVVITFAVAAPTDVEVAMLGARGKVVRHLAAGVLGGTNPPPAPLKPGLTQALTWNRLDDFGRPAGDGPFTVRVRVGLWPTFGRFIGGGPYTFGAIDSIAADEDGNIYVMGFAGLLNQGQMTLRVFDPEGRYVREIMPFPADLAPEAMKDVARWDEARTAFRPRNRKSLNPDFYGNPKGSSLTLVAASKTAGVVLTDGTRLYALEPTGAVRGASFITKVMWPKKLIPWGNVPNSGGGPVFLAVSPDGTFVYLSGIYTCQTRYGHKPNPALPPGRIYRTRLDGTGTMREFVTIAVDHKEGVGGAWAKHLRKPGHYTVPKGPVHQVTVDGDGRVYVADREHDRIAVFDASGKPAGAIAVKWPDLVAVHPTTGAVYVMQKDCVAYGRFEKVLLKFDSLKAGARPVARHEFSHAGRWPSMAVSAGTDRTVVWVAGVEGDLVALEDRGNTFEPITTHFRPRPGAQRDFNRLAVDDDRDEVYVSDGGTKVWRYDGETGEGGLLTRDGKAFPINDLAVGYDGLLYVRVSNALFGAANGYSGPFWRLTRDLQPAPYSETGTHELSRYIYSRYGIGFAERGIGVGPRGTAYLSFMYKWVGYLVGGFDPDGRPIKGRYLQGKVQEANFKQGQNRDLNSAVIGPVPPANGGIRVDLAGNIYIGMRVWPKGVAVPAAFEKDRAYRHAIGSVVKFPPAGGCVANDREDLVKPSGAKGIAMDRGEIAEGALAVYPGLAPFSHAGFGGNTCCVCRVPRFDIDRYGRLAMPNAVTNAVLLMDNAGNLIAEIGRYGNFDSQYVNPAVSGAGAGTPMVAVPAIPLAWPTGAGFSENHLYVNDTYNRRVVRVDLPCTAEATCRVR